MSTDSSRFAKFFESHKPLSQEERLKVIQKAWLRRVRYFITPVVENIVEWVRKAVVTSLQKNPGEDVAKLTSDGVNHVLSIQDEDTLLKRLNKRNREELKVAMHSFVRAYSARVLEAMNSKDKVIVSVPTVFTFFKSLLARIFFNFDPMKPQTKMELIDFINKTTKEELLHITPPSIFDPKSTEIIQPSVPVPEPVQEVIPPVEEKVVEEKKPEEVLPALAPASTSVEDKKKEEEANIADVKFFTPEARPEEGPLEPPKLDVQSNPQINDEKPKPLEVPVESAVVPATEIAKPIEEEPKKEEPIEEIKEKDTIKEEIKPEDKPKEEEIVEEKKKAEETEDKKVEESFISSSPIEETQSEVVAEKKIEEETPKNVIAAVEEIEKALQNSPTN